MSLVDRLGAAALGPLVVLLFLPVVVYYLNLDSVTLSKAALLANGLVACMLATLALWPLTYLPRVGGPFRLALELIGLALFVLLVVPNRSGEMAGFDDDLGKLGQLVPSLKLAGLILLGFAVHRLRPRAFRSSVRTVLVVSVAGGALLLLLAPARPRGTSRSRAERASQLLALGTESNLLVLVLDCFTGYRMVEILAERPELAERFRGFTLYPRAIASAVNTPAGSSAILTGDLRLAIETSKWAERNKLSLENSFLAEARRKRIRAAYISPLVVARTDIPAADEQDLYGVGRRMISSRVSEYLRFAAVSTARVLPRRAVSGAAQFAAHVSGAVARWTNSPEREIELAQTPSERAPLASKLAFDRILGELHVGSFRRKALYIHSKVSHPPWNLTSSGRFVRDVGWEESSVFVALRVADLLDRLRRLGSYDDSLIVVTADHGAIPLRDSTMGGTFDAQLSLPEDFNPLLMVKPQRASAPLRTSRMTVWLGDVAATARDFYDLPAPRRPLFASRSLLLPEDPERTLDLPLFFRPAQVSFHGALQEWTRRDVRGTFEAFGRAASEGPEQLLAKPARVTLQAGEDRYGSKRQERKLGDVRMLYGAWLLIDGRPIAEVESPGAVILSDGSGALDVDRSDQPTEGFAVFESTAPTGTVLAALVGVPRRSIPERLARGIPPAGEDRLLNCLLVSSPRGRPSNYARCSVDDLALDVDWR